MVGGGGESGEPGEGEAGVGKTEIAKVLADQLDRPLMVCSRTGGKSTRIWETAEGY